jgi:hypothetical protein
MTDHEVLIERIRAAFDNPYPGDDNIVEQDKVVRYAPDYFETYEDFKGKTWESLTPDFLEYHYDSIYFFSPVGFVYYLPAYLTYALRNPLQSNIPDTVMFSLAPPDNESLTDYFAERVNQITSAQSSVIYTYIQEYMTIDPDTMEIDKALEYWKVRSEAGI